MRFIILITFILTACLWTQPGRSDIYMWTDENGVSHFTNENPPAHAKVLMRTKEIPYDEAADQARQNDERQQELLQTQRELLETKEQFVEQQAEARRRIAEADRKAEEALQRAEDLTDSTLERHDSGHNYYPANVYYPKKFKTGHYRSSTLHDTPHKGTRYYKKNNIDRGQRRFTRRGSVIGQPAHRHVKASKFHRGRIHKKFGAAEHYYIQKRHLHESRASRLRPHAGSGAGSRGYHRGGTNRR